MPKSANQNTKIVATVGPACSSFNGLLELAKAGVDVFRLNFSHGTHEEHLEVIQHITNINEKYKFHLGILADLQGPKIRIGEIEEKEVLLVNNREIVFTTDKSPGTAERVHISYEFFPKEVQAGERILLDDGKLILEVVSTDKEKEVRLKIIHGGKLSSRKGVNLPDTKLSIPSITIKDREDLDFILTQPVNWIALSFVRRPEDVKELADLIEAANHSAKNHCKN
jgi:pyruvate kinase